MCGWQDPAGAAPWRWGKTEAEGSRTSTGLKKLRNYEKTFSLSGESRTKENKIGAKYETIKFENMNRVLKTNRKKRGHRQETPPQDVERL